MDAALDDTLHDARRTPVSQVDLRATNPPDAPAAPDALIGTRLHHFRVLRRLGEGGMGAVYAAMDESLEREVALKVLHPEYATNPALRDRFVREARAQARLHSHNVVHIYYIGQDAERLFFAMQLVDGPSLDRFIEQRGKPLSVLEALDAMADVARALAEAHQCGFIHRDIKPSNLLRLPDGTVKLADFGLVRPIATDSKITQAGMIIGSPAYMSPEQGLGVDTDHRSDMYSLGATFFHLLTGHPPYEGTTPIATITKHVTEPLPGPEALPGIPRPVVDLLRRLLAKKPEERFASYDDLVAAINAARPQKVTFAGVATRAAVALVDHGTFLLMVLALRVWAIPLFTAYVVAATTLRGQTLGAYTFRVQATREDGGRLSVHRALVRHLVFHWFAILVGAQYLIVDGFGGLERQLRESARLGAHPHAASATMQPMLMMGAAALWNGVFLALYIVGLGLALVDKRRRTLHDRAAGSVVTYRL